MRERFNAVDTAGRTNLNQATPLITCKSNKPMEKAKNGARYFRNPPQPHMCIQDFILGCQEPCYINVLSWIKISTPRRPEDPIPLYGGMRIPYNNTAVLAMPSDKKNLPKKQPIIFAVMANPEILRLSGKTAKDPMDRDALVDLMLDFVEAMNPEVKFKREFSVLKDRDLTGELKDIWLAIQVKREREKEKAENGKKLETGDREKRKDGRDDDTWQDVEKQRDMKTIDLNKEKEKCTEVLWYAIERNRKVDIEPKNTILPYTKPDQENGKKYNVPCEDNQEEDIHMSGIPLSSFNTEIRKLGEAAVMQITNSMLTACEGSVTPSRETKSSPTHQRKSKIRSGGKGDPFGHHLNDTKDRKGELVADIPCINEITKHTVFKEIFPSSSDSSEDEEMGGFRFNNVYKSRENGNSSLQASKQRMLHDARVLNDNAIDIDAVKNEHESDPGMEPNSPHKAACLEEACSYESTDSDTSNVKPFKFLRMKSSAIKKSFDKQVTGKQNVYVANKFKNPEQADYEPADTCQANVGRLPDYDC